jgi:hypothetical protein
MRNIRHDRHPRVRRSPSPSRLPSHDPPRGTHVGRDQLNLLHRRLSGDCDGRRSRLGVRPAKRVAVSPFERSGRTRREAVRMRKVPGTL